MPSFTIMMMAGGLFVMLGLVVFAFAGPSAAKTKARRLGWWMGTVVAAGVAAEMVLIAGQVVVRGRQLHFNMSTPADELIHNIMATTIYLVWAAVLYRNDVI